MNRRLGTFNISREMIEDDEAAVKLALSGLIVVRAEQLWDGGCIAYVAICDDFEELQEGDAAPPYQINWKRVQLEDRVAVIPDGWRKL